jgi:hypothetical protein
VLPRLQRGKLLRAWSDFLKDTSLVIKRTDRYGAPQLAIWARRPVSGIISALSFVIASLHSSVRSGNLAAVGLEDLSVFDEQRRSQGSLTRRLFLGTGPARLINVGPRIKIC